ncbi:hypothetical protein ILUMI_17837 [Ignelater luminosus]|uniref:Uncharacterized protein n=1 Tax=Ignelater luminosus TaxID=2038154 RepID=A0A8K0CMJ6_IGNLU|nr:hypothetical protein ILUMI_17837 [Ignelater luminosus]
MACCNETKTPTRDSLHASQPESAASEPCETAVRPSEGPGASAAVGSEKSKYEPGTGLDVVAAPAQVSSTTAEASQGKEKAKTGKKATGKPKKSATATSGSGPADRGQSKPSPLKIHLSAGESRGTNPRVMSAAPDAQEVTTGGTHSADSEAGPSGSCDAASGPREGTRGPPIRRTATTASKAASDDRRSPAPTSNQFSPLGGENMEDEAPASAIKTTGRARVPPIIIHSKATWTAISGSYDGAPADCGQGAGFRPQPGTYVPGRGPRRDRGANDHRVVACFHRAPTRLHGTDPPDRWRGRPRTRGGLAPIMHSEIAQICDRRRVGHGPARPPLSGHQGPHSCEKPGATPGPAHYESGSPRQGERSRSRSP